MEWGREELLILYLTQMNDEIWIVGVNWAYFRTHVHCIYSVIVSFEESIYCFPPQTAIPAWPIWLK